MSLYVHDSNTLCKDCKAEETAHDGQPCDQAYTVHSLCKIHEQPRLVGEDDQTVETRGGGVLGDDGCDAEPREDVRILHVQNICMPLTHCCMFLPAYECKGIISSRRPPAVAAVSVA